MTQSRVAKFAPWLIPIQLFFLISNPWNDKRNIVDDVDKVNYEKFYTYVSSLPGEIWIPLHGYTAPYTQKKDYAGFDCLRGALLPVDSRARALRFQLDTALANKHWSYILSDLKQKYPYYKLSGTMPNLNKVHVNDDTLLYIYTPEK